MTPKDQPRKTRERTKERQKQSQPSHLVKLLKAPEVMLHLHNEHKYMTKLLNVLLDELGEMDKSSTPDLAIMYDVARYMSEFSDTSHHPKEDAIYKKLAERDPASNGEMHAMLMEHETIAKKTDSLMACLNSAMQNPSPANMHDVRFRSEDYIATMNGHMDLEESQLFPRVLETLTEEDWASIIAEIQPSHDPLFGKIVEKRYQQLFETLSREMERAAEDFTMAELVGLGAAMENIGVIATYSNSLASIVSRRFKQAYRGNMIAYRKLWRARSRNPGDYMSVTIDCMLNNLDTYTDALRDIGRVLRKARTQIAEPYASRLRIYHDVVRHPGKQGSEAMQDSVGGNG